MMGLILANAFSSIPSANPRLLSGSASTAYTLKPSFLKSFARFAETVVFPTPPLPDTAIFTIIILPVL
jgi:hypothetical protein